MWEPDCLPASALSFPGHLPHGGHSALKAPALSSLLLYHDNSSVAFSTIFKTCLRAFWSCLPCDLPVLFCSVRFPHPWQLSHSSHFCMSSSLCLNVFSFFGVRQIFQNCIMHCNPFWEAFSATLSPCPQ